MAERYCTKKSGTTEVYPFRSMEDISNMINYYKDREEWDNYLIVMFGFLLGRRISDTINMKWSDLYEPNGRRKNEIRTIEEMKTGKITTIPIAPMVWKVIDCYLEKTNKNPMSDLNNWIFEYAAKTEWKSKGEYEDSITVERWCKINGKDFSESRMKKIYDEFHKQKEYKKISEYLYYDVEFHVITKSQTEIFRKSFTKAAKSIGINYAVSTHTLRKTFGMWTRKLHPYDVDCLDVLQDIYGHSSSKVTLRYVGSMEERKRTYFEDMGDFIDKIESGNMEEIIKNSPVISLKSDDLRDIISEAIKESDENALDKFNRIMKMVDNLSIKSI